MASPGAPEMPGVPVRALCGAEAGDLMVGKGPPRGLQPPG